MNLCISPPYHAVGKALTDRAMPDSLYPSILTGLVQDSFIGTMAYSI